MTENKASKLAERLLNKIKENGEDFEVAGKVINRDEVITALGHIYDKIQFSDEDIDLFLRTYEVECDRAIEDTIKLVFLIKENRENN